MFYTDYTRNPLQVKGVKDLTDQLTGAKIQPMNEITFRPATAADKPAVVAFTQHTWPHGDYIPEIYDAWLTDARGPFLVAEVKGEVVAVSKVTFLGPDQAWLEGLRVHPEHRRRGLARQFLAYEIALAQSRGARVVRFATAWDNFPIHKIAAEAGMRHVASFVPYWAEALPGPVRARALRQDDLAAAWDMIAASEVYRRSGGLYDQGWAWKELNPAEVAQLIQKGDALGWQAPGRENAWAGVALLLSDFYDREALRICWLGGDMTQMTEFARDLRYVAAARGLTRVHVPLVDWPELRAALTAAGYQSDPGGEGFSLWIFEKALS
jgi:GNAT superfamily N-acetyltransferase